MNRLALVAVALCTACSGLKPPDNFPVGGGSGGSGGGGGAQSSTPPDLLPLLTVFGTGATRLLADVGNVKLELDPTVKDPFTALAGCADLVSYCYAPPAVGISECFARARACTTTEPWSEPSPCCPTDCKRRFDAEVAGGMGHVPALEKVLFLEPDCFPGVRAALEAP